MGKEGTQPSAADLILAGKLARAAEIREMIGEESLMKVYASKEEEVRDYLEKLDKKFGISSSIVEINTRVLGGRGKSKIWYDVYWPTSEVIRGAVRDIRHWNLQEYWVKMSAILTWDQHEEERDWGRAYGGNRIELQLSGVVKSVSGTYCDESRVVISGGTGVITELSLSDSEFPSSFPKAVAAAYKNSGWYYELLQHC